MNTLPYFSKLLRSMEKGSTPDIGIEAEQTAAQVAVIKKIIMQQKDSNVLMLKKEMDNAKLECCKSLLRALKLKEKVKSEPNRVLRLNQLIVLKSVIEALEELYSLYVEILALPLEELEDKDGVWD